MVDKTKSLPENRAGTVETACTDDFSNYFIFHDHINVRDDLLAYMKKLNDENRNCVECIVEIKYTDDNIQQFPYFGTYDIEDFIQLKHKFSSAKSVSVYNLKYFRDLYFGCNVFEGEK